MIRPMWLILLGTGCGGGQGSVPEAEVPWATWDGGQLSARHVNDAAATALSQLERDHEVKRWELLRRTATQQVDRALLDAEAAARNVDVETWLSDALKPPDGGAEWTEGERELRQRRLLEGLRSAHGVRVSVPYPELPRSEVPVDADDPTLGPADAAVTLVVFSEYQCSYCRDLDATLARLVERHPENLRIVFKEFPHAGHPRALAAAVAARCAAEQGLFLRAHRDLFDRQDALSDADLEGLSENWGLTDPEAYAACRTSGRYESAIMDDVRVGRRLGVEATPTVFIEGLQIVGAQSLEVYDEIIRRGSGR